MRPKTRLSFFFSWVFSIFLSQETKEKSLPLFISPKLPLQALSPFFFLPVQFKGQGAIDKHVSARNDGAPFSSVFHGQSDPPENPSQ